MQLEVEFTHEVVHDPAVLAGANETHPAGDVKGANHRGELRRLGHVPNRRSPTVRRSSSPLPQYSAVDR